MGRVFKGGTWAAPLMLRTLRQFYIANSKPLTTSSLDSACQNLLFIELEQEVQNACGFQCRIVHNVTSRVMNIINFTAPRVMAGHKLSR
jgi:hypothetical protein